MVQLQEFYISQNMKNRFIVVYMKPEIVNCIDVLCLGKSFFTTVHLHNVNGFFYLPLMRACSIQGNTLNYSVDFAFNVLKSN